MGSKLLGISDVRHRAREQFAIDDHFTEFTDAQRWTVAVAGTGTIAHEGSAGRSAMRFFNTAANDAAVLATTHEIFKFRAGKAMEAEAIILGADVDTDDGMLFFGWADALAATSIADTTGAVTATDACCLVKLPDSRFLTLHTEINGVAVTTTSADTVLTSANQLLTIEVQPHLGGSTLRVVPKLNGVQLKTAAGALITHDIVIGTATDMDFGMMTKSNDAADYIVFLDYIHASQLL